MFELKKKRLKPYYLLNHIMPCLITPLTRAFIEKTTRKKNIKRSKNKNFTVKTKYLNLNAPSNNAKMQLHKTLTAKIYFVLTIQQMAIFLNETR